MSFTLEELVASGAEPPEVISKSVQRRLTATLEGTAWEVRKRKALAAVEHTFLVHLHRSKIPVTLADFGAPHSFQLLVKEEYIDRLLKEPHLVELSASSLLNVVSKKHSAHGRGQAVYCYPMELTEGKDGLMFKLTISF